MKIKVRDLDYDAVTALPRRSHRPPRTPGLLFRTLVRALAEGDLRDAGFTFTREEMEKVGEGPWLILMNHSSFIDLEIVSKLMYPKPYNIICTSDGFVGKEGLMRAIGCVPTDKFISDLTLMADMEEALKKNGCSVLMYPEASYSFDGTATPLPRKMGVLLKRLGVPVVMIRTQGAFSRDPLYNGLQKRKVKVSAVMRGLFSLEKIREKSVAELDRALDEAFTFDHFRWQEENGIEIREPFRADGLERILYKCPHCLSEESMEGKGETLTCRACGRSWTLMPLGRLESREGETRFPHIPDWYAWERQEVRRELEAGRFELTCPVEILMLVDYKAIYRVGEGRLTQDETGIRIEGCGGRLQFERPARLNYSLYADYFWYELGDMISVGDGEALYYCFPRDKTPVAKARLAAEESYKLQRERRRAR